MKSNIIQSVCPLCQSADLHVFLQRNAVPIQQNILTSSLETSLKTPRGKLEMTFCNQCGFVFNKSFDPELMDYNQDYNNTQEASQHFLEHLRILKEKIMKHKSLEDSIITEIGCGKGFFLKMLVLDNNHNIVGHGFDPTYEGNLVLEDGKLNFERRYFDSSCKGFKTNILVCRHVIEHIPNPMHFINEIANAISSNEKVSIFFETPCIDWIFKTNTFWDFFYEHCSLFSASTLRFAFEKSGFYVKSVEHVFDGQYLWLEAEKKSSSFSDVKYPSVNLDVASQFAANEVEMIAEWKELLEKLIPTGKVAVWGAGAKGVTFVNMIDPEQKLISALIDVNSDKQGKFVPGTGHPVINYSDVEKNEIKHAIIMNPNYYEENLLLITKANIKLNLIRNPGDKI